MAVGLGPGDPPLASADTGGLTIARQGQALLSVVVSPKATEGTRESARDLIRVLTRMTGAPFKLTQGNGSKGIVVGTLRDFPDPSLKSALEVRNSIDGVESY